MVLIRKANMMVVRYRFLMSKLSLSLHGQNYFREELLTNGVQQINNGNSYYRRQDQLQSKPDSKTDLSDMFLKKKMINLILYQIATTPAKERRMVKEVVELQLVNGIRHKKKH